MRRRQGRRTARAIFAVAALLIASPGAAWTLRWAQPAGGGAVQEYRVTVSGVLLVVAGDVLELELPGLQPPFWWNVVAVNDIGETPAINGPRYVIAGPDVVSCRADIDNNGNVLLGDVGAILEQFNRPCPWVRPAPSAD